VIWFESWETLGRIALISLVAYAALVCFLRISGKRTLSKLNAFDLVVTMALGSTLATMILSEETAVASGLVALASLVALQYAVASLSERTRFVWTLVKNEPALLFHAGEFLEESLRRERVTRDELLAAMRAQGFADLAQVRAVVLETDGSMSVIQAGEAPEAASTLRNVANDA
jgi:uncharacterized membrane protein YcaP (DUF421 family)